EVNCWCDLRATRSVRLKDLEPYFGCPLERENKSCDYFERLDVREAVDRVTKAKDQIIRGKSRELVLANKKKENITREKDNII
ncbi:hypothetical protein LINPERHAP1_LOCUS1534, partial [Linum perenne]